MNIKLHVVLSVFLGGVLTVSGQSLAVKNKITKVYEKNDKVGLRTFSSNIDKTYDSKVLKQRASDLGLPLTFTDIRGNAVRAVGVDFFGNIIYLTTFNGGSRVTSNVNDISPGGELGLSLDGTNMQIGVWDGDVGLSDHVEFKTGATSRLIMKEKPYTDNYKSKETIEARSHATHVAGTVGAYGNMDRAQGMAPESTIISYNWDNDIREMKREASNGLLMSNHSYGMSAFQPNGVEIPKMYFGAYDSRAAEVDALTNLYKYYLPVIAAGNDGWQGRFKANIEKGGNELLLGMSTSKNPVIVSAIGQINNYQGPDDVSLAIFNSNGPTNDFRIKPDISAKGLTVYSTDYKNDTDLMEYQIKQGTSMAAPAVTGIVALWQQWAIENKGMPYVSSTIKAVMVHSALEAGPEPGPDHKFGWGVIDARKGVEVMMSAVETNSALIEENILTDGETYTKKFTIGPDGTNFKATIAWIDPEGGLAYENFDEAYMKNNPILVNDLDLRVYKDGEEFFPWRLNKDFNSLLVQKGDNDVDNIEQVEIENPEEGEYEIQITNKKKLKYGTQAYALVFSTDADVLDESTEGNQVEVSKKIVMWPNPVENELNIVIPSTIEDGVAEITVFDVNRRQVVDANSVQTIGNGVFRIELQGLGSGVYFVEVKQGAYKQTEKIIKK